MLRQYFPFVAKEKESLSSILRELIAIILLAEWQKRPRPVVNPLLMKAAQTKAEDMALKEYFSHTSPDGISANENVRSAGYVLPDWYPEHGNNVESIALGYMTPAKVVEGWLNSPNHRVHLAGEIDFYRNQNQLGVGMTVNKKKALIWVFLSAP